MLFDLPLHFDKKDGIFCRSFRGETSFMVDKRIGLPQGTLDLLILKVLSLGPQHGWAISERLGQISTGVVQVQQGSLYPALHRLERRGWIKAEWAASDNNRNAKYYELTRAGRKQLETETVAWRTLSSTIGQILDIA
jgi:PadR family transcriptional regulator, regulatory protein PadR